MLTFAVTIFTSFYVKQFYKFSILSVCYFLIVLSVSILVTFATKDFSFDGNAYHLAAIKLIASGNNLYKCKTISDFVAHYPKNSWLISGAILNITNNINLTRIPVWLSFFSLVILTRVLFLDRNYYPLAIPNCIKPLALSVLILPAIYAGQLLTNYNDYYLYCNLISCAILLVIYSCDADIKKIYMAIFFNLLAFSIKFNGVPLAALESLFIVYVLWKSGKILSIFGYLILIFWIIFDPIILNALDYGNPVYPLFTGGVDPISLVSVWHESHKDFPEIVRAIQAIFLKFGTTQVSYSYPFALDTGVLSNLGRPDTFAGGQGIFGSTIFILIVVLIALLFLMRNYKKSLILLGSVIVSLSYPGSSFARYAFLYPLLPILVMIYSQYPHRLGVLKSVVIVILTINFSVAIAGTMALQLIKEERLIYVESNQENIVVGTRYFYPSYLVDGYFTSNQIHGTYVKGCFESAWYRYVKSNVFKVCDGRLL